MEDKRGINLEMKSDLSKYHSERLLIRSHLHYHDYAFNHATIMLPLHYCLIAT